MADKTEFLQAIDDAILDADSLERFINGSDSETVLTRLSKRYPTLQNAIKQMFESGGLPATPFKTKVAMQSSNLGNDSYAIVTDDGDNNGLYIKQGGAWVKSRYDFAEIITSAVHPISDKINAVVRPESFEPVRKFPSNVSFTWLGNQNSYKGTIVPVNGGETYRIEASSNDLGSTIYQLTTNDVASLTGFIDQTAMMELGKDEVVDVKMRDDTKYLWCSYNSNLNQISPKSVMALNNNILFGADVVDRLDSNSTDTPLSARQGSMLNSMVASTDSELKPNIIPEDYTPIRYFASITQERWIRVNGYTGVVIPVKSGVEYIIDVGEVAESCFVYPVSVPNPQVESGFDASKIVEIASNSVATYKVPYGYNYLWVSHTNNYKVVLPESIKEARFNPVLYSDISYDAYGYEDGKVPSLSMFSESKRDIDELKATLGTIPSAGDFEKLDMQAYESYAVWNKSHTGIPEFSPNVLAISIELDKGDTLSFDYFPVFGTILWQGETLTSGYAILTELDSSDTPKSFEYTAYKSMTVYLANHKEGTVYKNGVKIDTSTMEYISNYARVTLHSQLTSYSPDPEFSDYKSLPEISVKKGDVIKITDAGSGGIVAVRIVSPVASGIYIGAVTVAPDNPNKEVIWEAPDDCRVMLSASNSGEFFIKRASSVAYAINNSTFSKATFDISEIYLPEMERVFATHQNYILKMEDIDGVEYITFSEDLGKTWKRTKNTLGDITTYHFFTDGTIMLCTKTKVYWTTDGINYNESVVYDYDGSIYEAPENSWRFFNQQNGDRPMSIDGVEMYVWGEYVRFQNGNPAIFYTTDFGRTIKCATRFGKSVMQGKVRPSRHVHRIYLDDKNERFYIATGDAKNECMLIEAEYTPATDTWDWNVLGSGDEWKFGTMWVDRFYLYLITDYTTTELKQKSGIYRVSLNHLEDISKYKMIYHADPDEWRNIAPFRLIVDRNGNKIQLPDVAGVGYIWVATDGLNFKKVRVHPRMLLSYIIGPNYDGDIYCSGSYIQDETQILSGTNFNLTKALRNAGVTDFMRGEIIFDNLVSFTE